MKINQKNSFYSYRLLSKLFSAIFIYSILCACSRSDQYKAGDKVFLTKKLMGGAISYGGKINLCQLIEPINGHGETYINYSPWAISVDTLLKYQSANLGNFQYTISKKKLKKQPSPMEFYAIIPNKKALIKTDLFESALPAGYKYASDKFFIFPSLTSPEETLVKK